MPALRSSLRRLVLVAAVCLASVASLFQPVTTPAAAASCPVSPPTPLRMLYKESERVVVASAGLSELDKSLGNDSYRRTTFHLSESLKGGHGESALQVVHYTNPEYPDFAGNFKKGDRLLLFLNYVEEQNAYSVGDMRHGAKKLSDEDLKVYVKRIEELSALLLKEKPDDREIVEWLVRCAEEPATRWEGAYELYAGFSIARNEASAAAAKQASEAGGEEEAEGEGEAEEAEEAEEQAAEAAEAGAGESVVESEEIIEVPLSVSTDDTGEGEGAELKEVERPRIDMKAFRLGMYGTDIAPEAVAALTPDQKTRLANALFRADKVGEGETTLLDIVKGWGDERLVPFLSAQLRGLEKDPPYFATELMSVLAEALKDKALAKLVENYIENAPYEDYVEGEVAVESDEDEEGASEKESRASDENRTKVSAVQKRGEMLREFLNAAENRVQYDLAMQLSR